MNTKEAIKKQTQNLEEMGAKSVILLDFFDFLKWLQSYCGIEKIEYEFDYIHTFDSEVKILSSQHLADREDLERTFFNMQETKTLHAEDLSEIIGYLILFGEIPFGNYQFIFDFKS